MSNLQPLSHSFERIAAVTAQSFEDVYFLVLVFDSQPFLKLFGRYFSIATICNFVSTCLRDMKFQRNCLEIYPPTAFDEPTYSNCNLTIVSLVRASRPWFILSTWAISLGTRALLTDLVHICYILTVNFSYFRVHFWRFEVFWVNRQQFWPPGLTVLSRESTSGNRYCLILRALIKLKFHTHVVK